MEVTPPGNREGEDLEVSDDPKDVVTSPPRELKTPDGGKDATPKVDMAASPSEVLRTPSKEKVATPPEKATASKKLTQGMEGVTPIKESEKEIEEEINEIGENSQKMTTPQRQNIFIIYNYWETVGTSAKNLKFSEEDLKID